MWGKGPVILLFLGLALVYSSPSPDNENENSLHFESKERYGGGWSKAHSDAVRKGRERAPLRRTNTRGGNRRPDSEEEEREQAERRQRGNRRRGNQDREEEERDETTTMGGSLAQTQPLHPLDPLTEDEIRQVVAIIQRFRSNEWVYNYIALKEPEKTILLPFFLQNRDPTPGSIPRRSFVVLLDRQTQRTYQVLVNLNTRQVESFTDAGEGVQPSLTLDEMAAAERIAKADPEVIRRCLLLGWDDMTRVNGDPWSIGYIEDRPEYRGRRLTQLYMYGKNFDDDNQYAHPFDFLPIIDLNEGRVIDIEELPTHDDFDASNKRGNIVPRATSNYDPELRDPNSFRDDLRPVNISQPEGVSYTITGNQIEWQKFKMRVRFTGREGLVIHNVNYRDGSEVRPLFYRMSLAEMFIPYGDPRPPYHRKHVFDEGQYGVGVMANELRPQVDCLGEVHFFDAVLHNDKGEPRTVPRTVCVHEEDAGILWKHTDFRTGKSALVRSQRLALTFIATVGNYDYIFTWHFYQDATIEFNVKLSGILSTNLLATGATPAGHGSIVAPQINAQYHQHFFGLRLDPEIDGNRNTVVMNDVIPLPAPTGSRTNPYGQGFTTRNTVLRTAGAARTSISPENSRTWHIRNPNRRNPNTREPVAWKLMPWATPKLMLRNDSPHHDQAGWLDYNTWVTPFAENQYFPAGFFLGNNTGLPEIVGSNPRANVDNVDIVVWHNLGISHVPRAEDYPVMPVESCGIMLKPMNFFNENPALDVPGPQAARDEL